MTNQFANRFLSGLVRVAAIVVACLGVLAYIDYISPRTVEYASPLRDHSENRVVKKTATRIGDSFAAFQTKVEPGPFAHAWPCFRGAKRDNVCAEKTQMTKSWSDAGPKVLWRKTLGEGYAGAIVADGRVYILDYLEKEEADALRCFELFSGEELWRRSYRNPIRRNHGKSRTVPACADNVVVSLGPAAHVMAVDAATGQLLWTRDLVNEYKCEVPQWYAGQCPLIDDGKVVLGIGGEKVFMAALDLKSGKTVWETPNEHGVKMSHSSVVAATLAGRRQYVYAGIGGIGACSSDGRPLWTCTEWKPAVWAPTPVPIDGEQLFLTAGYGAGSAILRLTKDGNRYLPQIASIWKPTKGPASEQQTPIVLDGTLYVIQPKDAGALRAQLVAADVTKLPEIACSSGKDARFGLGPYLYADNAIWIVDDNGVLYVYTRHDATFALQARFKVLPGADSWGPVALAGGIMILRDSTSMVCLDLRKETAP